MTDTPLSLDGAALERLQDLCSQPAHDLLAAIRAEFGEADAPMLYNLAVMMLAGWVLKSGGQAERAPNAIDQLWAVMDVPFSIVPRQMQ